MTGQVRRISILFRKAPIVCYLTIACAFTWTLLFFATDSIPISLLALFGPTVSALTINCFLTPDRRQDFYRIWSSRGVISSWSMFAVLLPLPVTTFRSIFEYVLGARGEVVFQSINGLGLLVFILVIGEEIGWRGFALPLLLPSFGATGSSVIIGTMWAFWHLPLFLMSSMPQYGSPFLAFVIYTVCLSTILTFLYQRTHGSIIVSALFHGAVNTIGIVNVAASSELRGWSNALSYGLASLVISGVTGKTRICR